MAVDWLFMAIVLLPLLLAMLVGSAATAAQTERPNVILIVTDDQRNDFLGCAGNPVLRTPVIDRLAAEGVRFSNAFVTTPICAASRASILTGAWERGHGYTFGTPPLREELVANSYPALLRDAGYRTGFIGKFGVNVESGSSEQMFDFFRPQSQPYLEKGDDGRPRHLTDLAGDAALEFLQGCKKDQPFCLSVSFNAPHAQDADKQNQFPFPASDEDLYADTEIPSPLVPAEFRESLPKFLADSLARERWYWRWDTTEKYQRNVRAYYRMISGIDRVVGQVLAESERLGFANNTVVIFTGDNGYFLGSRGFAGKWLHYDESLRVPLVIHDPRIAESKRGRVVPQQVLNVDLSATILDLAGLAPPASCRGRSLTPLVRGDVVEKWRGDFFAEHLFDHPKIPKWEGVRGQRYVYARYFDHLPEGEFLHDLEQDPLQLVNLAHDPNHAKLLAEMRIRCDALRTDVGPPLTTEIPDDH